MRGSAGGDHNILGFFCDAPNLVVWLREDPKQTLYTFKSPNFILINRPGVAGAVLYTAS